MTERDEARLRGYEGDACWNCGQFTLARNGTCLKCDIVRRDVRLLLMSLRRRVRLRPGPPFGSPGLPAGGVAGYRA